MAFVQLTSHSSVVAAVLMRLRGCAVQNCIASFAHVTQSPIPLCMAGRGYVTSHASLGGVKKMYGKSALSDYAASLEPRPKQRYSENLAFVPTEPFLTRLVQSYTQQLVTRVRSMV